MGLLLVVGGDDEGGGAPASPAAAARAPSALEREVARHVERVVLKRGETEDVAAFRRPKVREVRCEQRACAAEYVIGLPGAGRIREDQIRMVAPIFAATDVPRIRLRVWRDAVVGPNRRLKAEEEAPAGTPLLDTTCDRSSAGGVDWDDEAAAFATLAEICTTLRFNPGDPAPAALEPPGPRPQQTG